ncbi:hypothetical protein HZY86_05230 [Aerococcaceae bacterium DSM 111020]|nr:hypothetical protein [Aerococcaceae bacterium DSM 111020]
MHKQVTTKLRLTSILTDWLVMNVGLLLGIVLILIFNLIYRLITGNYLAMTLNHFLLIFIVYLPWIGLHIWFDMTKNGSLGKQLFQLILHYNHSGILTIIIRNFLKWAPIFTIISTMIFIIMTYPHRFALGIMIGSLIWIIANFIVLMTTKGQWHLIDKIVGTRVIKAT